MTVIEIITLVSWLLIIAGMVGLLIHDLIKGKLK